MAANRQPDNVQIIVKMHNIYQQFSDVNTYLILIVQV